MGPIRTRSLGGSLKARSPRWLLNASDHATRTIGLLTEADRPAPDFLIIGTKRGGTTSLYNYLMQHPGILGTYPRIRSLKSTNFFFADDQHDERWYRSHFHTEHYRAVLRRRLGYRPLGFEASPYYMWDPRIAPKVATVAPHVKAIALVRNPVRRAWSHYQERVQNGVEPLSFQDSLALEADRLAGELEHMEADHRYHSTARDWYSYRSRGEYLAQLTGWEASFPPERLLVVASEKLYREPQAVIDQVCDFLHLPTHKLPSLQAFNATWRTRNSVPGRQADELADHFAPHNRRLEKYLGWPLEWDS